MRSMPGCVGIVVIVGLLACTRAPRRIDDPLTIMLSDRQSERVRESAVLEARAQAGDDPVAIRAVAAGWEEAVLAERTPQRVRRAALHAILRENDDAVQQRAQGLIDRLLPNESSPELVEAMCMAAGERGWQACVPALVRRAARPDSPASSAQGETPRPELVALNKLRQGATLEDTMFSVVVDPPHQEPRFGVDPVPRTQQDAWRALCRLEPSNERRAAMVRAATPTNPRGINAIEALRAAMTDLRSLPDSGEEFAWLLMLRESKDERATAWWREAATAVARAPVEEALDLRHAEALRWASAHRSLWLGMGRESLLDELRSRVSGRVIRERAQPASRRLYRETLAGQEDALHWGDLVQLLVLDEVLHDEELTAALLKQARLDERDVRAQYGGVLVARRDEPARCVPVLYLPRAAQRLGDERFAPGEDMIRLGAHCLAFYRFNAQRASNANDAGPTLQDLSQTLELRRVMLVVTTLGRGAINIDAVLPTRTDSCAVIDLGVFRSGAESGR